MRTMPDELVLPLFSSSNGTSEKRPESAEDGAQKELSHKLFACPYSKHKPFENEERQSCFDLSWATIQHLREHIYHCHVAPIKCPNVSHSSQSSLASTSQLDSVPRCDRSLSEAAQPIRGLENLSEKILMTKIMMKNSSDEDIWKVIYTTLFPNDRKDNIPCPYYEGDAQRHNAVSLHDLRALFPSEGFMSSSHELQSQVCSNTQVGDHEGSEIASIPTPSSPIAGEHSQASHIGVTYEEVYRCRSLQLSENTQNICESDGGVIEGHLAGSIREEVLDVYQLPRTSQDRQKENPSKGRRLRKKIRRNTLEAQVTAFHAWKKPHRTDEHIHPGVYRGFWKWLARCLTFYIPSWFLRKYLKMNDVRRRLAFRQKVLFCLLLGIIYALLCYFLVIQPISSCVVKVQIGMFPNHSPFCRVVRTVIYVYMGLGGAFTMLVAICAARVRYISRKFDEHNNLLVMHIPCYNEDETVLRKTIQSCVESTYDKKRKLLFIVADGTVAAPGRKPTYKILLEDIFNHTEDLELGVDNQAQTYTSFDSNGTSDNRAFCCTGYFREVPYVIVVKVGRGDEQDNPKPGNRGKRDSQLLVYNFFHYVNYRRFWSPLFESLEFKMRICLNMDARDAMHMLVVDSDTEVEPTGVSYLVNQLQTDPKLVGVCGYTGVSNPWSSFVACSQVFEYWLTHAVLKAVESTCSNVLVLSGCFTIYRLKWPNNRPAILHPLILEDYAGIYDKTLHEHNLLSIGEDRYLSTLAIRYFGADCRLRYFPAAKCATSVPETLPVLLDQRRRWTNSLIHCHFAHLNVLPFEASIWAHIRLIFVIGCELFMVFILPLALPAGAVLAVISVLLTSYAWAILLAFCLLPVVICIVCNDWKYIPFYLPFFPMIAIFSIVIPLLSAWKQDNIRWGKTRGG